MPQFAFSATDPMGNTVEGTIQAANPAMAADQIRQMGYDPQRVQMSGGQAVHPAPALPNAAPAPTATLPQPPAPRYTPPPPPSGPPPIDLTQPITEMPAAANALRTPLGGETETGGMRAAERFERLEPWQRGGAQEQNPASGAEATLTGGSVEPTLTLSPITGAVMRAPMRPETARQSERPVPIPFGPGADRRVSLWQRLKETMVYPIFSGVLMKDLVPFYRQFATLISAGIPLHQSLVSLEASTANPKLKEIAQAGQRQVQAGGRFSDVMAAYPWIFQPVQIELVRAAELGGMLDEVLRNIADYVEHDLEIRRLVNRETLYPKIVIFLALMIHGKPGLFEGMPAIAGLVLGGSFAKYLADTIGFGLLCIGPFLIGTAVFRLFLFNIPGVREAYDTFKFSLPGLGKVTRQFALAKFTRTFAALYRGGFTMSQALQIAGNASGNAVVQKAAHRAILEAERGGLVSDALRTNDYFPPLVLDMFRTGETSGNLDMMLDKSADYMEKEAAAKSHMMAIAFGVGVLLLSALMVARVVIGFWGNYGAGISEAAGG